MYYILKNKEAVAINDVKVWGAWFETADRTVMRTYKEGGDKTSFISTVFLGLDHSYGGEPLLFETMVFDEDGGDYEVRCRTWDQAVEQHCRAVLQFYGQVIVPPVQTENVMSTTVDDPELDHERWS